MIAVLVGGIKHILMFITIFMTTFVPHWQTHGNHPLSRPCFLWGTGWATICRTNFSPLKPWPLVRPPKPGRILASRRCKIMSSHSMLLSMALKATWMEWCRCWEFSDEHATGRERKRWQKLAMNQLVWDSLRRSPESSWLPRISKVTLLLRIWMTRHARTA